MGCSPQAISSPPSAASGAVPKVANVIPSAFNAIKASKTKSVAVPSGASGKRRTSSRYQALRAGIGLAARKPTNSPSTRAAKYFLWSECRKGSRATNQPNVVPERRVSSQRRQSLAVSCLNFSSTVETTSTLTPARRAWFTPARSFFALSPRGFQVLRSKYGDAPTFTGVNCLDETRLSNSVLAGTNAATLPFFLTNAADCCGNSVTSSRGARGSPAANQTRPNSP